MVDIAIYISLIFSPILSFLMMYLLLNNKQKMSRFFISLFFSILVWTLFILLNILQK
ncbi:hypothetical protein J2T13_003234 [Paenibacillus sp. DS2015]